MWLIAALIDAPSLVDFNFVAATCRRCVHTLRQGCLRLFCRCDMSHEFKPVWIRATDRSDKILSQRQWFSHDTRRFVTATCRGGVSQRFVASFVSAFNNDRATTTRHNYSKWRRPGNWKTKASVFDIYIFQTQTPSFEKLGTKFIVKTMFCGLELFCCFNGGFP